MREIYADHAGTAPVAPEVIDAMHHMLEPAHFGNASSVHRRGEAARDAIETARGQVAALLGALPEEIVFTASGSEANNLAIKGALAAAPAGCTRLVISSIEHPSVLETARYLEASGVALTLVPVNRDGIIDLARLEAALGPDVALVSVMWVNNEIGTVQPIAEIAARVGTAGAMLHCDAVQAAGKLAIDLATLPIDLLSIAAHKLGGPPGVGALFVRRRTRLVPLIHGGHQERSRRAGTENLPAVVGFGVAAERAIARLDSGEPARIAALGEQLCQGLIARVPDTRLNGDRALRLGGIVNLCFAGVDGEAVLHELDREGIMVSTGSACSAASSGPSHVLIAMGMRPEDAHASVRFSLGEGNVEADIDRILEVTPQVVARLRALEQRPETPAVLERADPQVRRSA